MAKVRADPESSAQTIREAEISLATAKLGVVEATESQTESVNALAEAQTLLDEAINGAKVSSEAFQDAAKELKDAQDRANALLVSKQRIEDESKTFKERAQKAESTLSEAEKQKLEDDGKIDEMEYLILKDTAKISSISEERLFQLI